MTVLRPSFSGYLRFASAPAGGLLYSGPVAPTRLHAHHAFQVMLATSEDPLAIRGESGEVVFAPAFILQPDLPHAIARPSVAVVAYFEPETLLGRRLRRRLSAASGHAEVLAAVMALRGPVPTDAVSADARLDSIAGALGATATASPQHPAVAGLARILAERLPNAPTLSAVASALGLAESSLSHVLKREVGIPYRRLVLWQRLIAAARELRLGADLTTAAHAAGFADLAHLSRTFTAMFGIVPSEVTRFVTWL
ncbi:MAG: hypothetical protein CNCCGFBP_01578 [Fimbriimonadaceae bacterium]|nr:hypothetical protein [Fimbriimonadaceae bacterium]